MDWRERIVTNPGLLGGQPAVKGTRLSVAFILDLLAAGSSEASILVGYSRLSVDDIRACLRYASASLQPPVVTEIDAWIDEGLYGENSQLNPKHKHRGTS